MGQFVRFDGTGYGTVTIPAFPSNVWRVRWRMQLDANQGSDRTFYLLGKTSGISNYLRFEDKADPTQNRVFLRIQNFSISLTAPNIDWTTDSIYEVESDGTNTRFIKDGTPVGNAQTVSYLFHQDLNYIGRNDGSIAPAGLDLYWLEIYQGGTIEHDYQPDSTGGTGTTLDDVAVGNADATLVGFTGSPWVEFFTIESVTNSTFEPGQTITFTTTAGFNPTSITITDGTKTCSPTLVSEVAPDTYSFVLPLGDVAGFPEFGALTLTATNGSDVADAQLTMNVPTGLTLVTLSGVVIKDETSVSWQFAAHPQLGDKYLFDAAVITIDQNNVLTIPSGATFSTIAYLLDGQGLQQFEVTDSLSADVSATANDSQVIVQMQSATAIATAASDVLATANSSQVLVQMQSATATANESVYATANDSEIIIQMQSATASTLDYADIHKKYAKLKFTLEQVA